MHKCIIVGEAKKRKRTKVRGNLSFLFFGQLFYIYDEYTAHTVSVGI